MSDTKDIELLETIELRFGLADSKQKVENHVNSFLVPLLYKLETKSKEVQSKGIGEIGSEGKDQIRSVKLDSKISSVYLLGILRDFFLFSPHSSSEESTIYPGLSVNLVAALTNGKKSSWANGGKTLIDFKKGVFDFLNDSTVFKDANCENERFIALMCASCDTINYDVASSATESIKKLDPLDYENTSLVRQFMNLYLGEKSDYLINESKDPCSPKLKNIIMKHLSKSVLAAQMFPDWIKIIFDCLFGKDSSESLKTSGVVFMRWVSQKSPLEQLRSSGPLLFQAIKKVLGIGANEEGLAIKNTRSHEILRMNTYNSWTTLITRVPFLFDSDISILHQTISVAEKESSNIKSNSQETIYKLGVSFFKKFADDISSTDKTLDILQNVIENSTSSQIKLTVLRILTDGPSFSNTRVKLIAMLGFCDSDSQVIQSSLACLNMDPNSLKIVFSPTNQIETSESLNSYYLSLPKVYHWIIAFLNFLINNNTEYKNNKDSFTSNIDKLTSILSNYSDFNLASSFHPKIIEPLMLFTTQLFILQGLFSIIRGIDNPLKNSKVEIKWIEDNTEFTKKEAEKLIINFSKPNSFVYLIFENPTVRLALYLSLKNLELEAGSSEPLQLLSKIPLLSLLNIKKYKEISNTISMSEQLEKGNEISSRFFKIVSELGPTKIHEFVMSDFSFISNCVLNSNSFKSQKNLSQGIAISLMTIWNFYLLKNTDFHSLFSISMPFKETEEVFLLASRLAENLKNNSELKSNRIFEKSVLTKTIGTLLLSATVLSRLQCLFIAYPVDSSVENISKIISSTKDSIDSIKSLLHYIFKEIYTAKVVNLGSESDMTPLLSSACICVRELGIFGNLNSFPISSSEISEIPTGKNIDGQISYYLFELIKSGKCSFSEINPLCQAICGISFGTESRDIDNAGDSGEADDLSLYSLKMFRDLCSSDKKVLKTFDTQLLISEIIPLVASKWDCLCSTFLYNGSLHFGFDKLNSLGVYSTSSNAVCWKWILKDALPSMAISQKVTERFAAATWAGSIALECSGLELMNDNCVSLHRIMCSLLLDSDEMVQSVAGKAISLIFESCSVPKDKDLMINDLIRALGSRRTLLLSNPNVSDVSTGLRNQLIPNSQPDPTNNDSPRQTENLTRARPNPKSIISLTYYTILDLANEIGYPQLFYHLVVLAGHSIQTSINFGLSSYSVKSVSNAIEVSNRFSSVLTPNLFFLCFNVNPAIAKSMNSIWNSLFNTAPPNNAYSISNGNFTYPVCSPIIIKNWESISKKCISNMGSSDWKIRQSSCSAMTFALSFSGNLVVNNDFISSIWKLSLRLLDDIKDSVRLEALTFCNSLAAATMIWCEESLIIPDKEDILSPKRYKTIDRTLSDNETNHTNSDSTISIVIQLMIDTGLASPAEDVRKFTLSFLNKLSHLKSIRPYSGVLVLKYLECLSDLEDQTLNYISQNASNWEISKHELDSFRLSSTKSSPTMVTLEKFLSYMTVDQMDEFVPQLCNIITRGIGLPTRTGTARVIVNLAASYPDIIREYSLTISRSILSVIKNSYGVEMYSWASAIAYTSPFLELNSFEKLTNILFKLFFSKDNNYFIFIFIFIFIFRRKFEASSSNNFIPNL
ncbi:Proteasome-associated protein ECM29-like protein [Smittium culicis]|uniref:Proteasome-associated protein ECM29-like protein n=1 Tax=Smittium culicis TaxID=133412 RepID=A0A1R1YHE6_9FUNG|nr:Proteasome-associated protein ECM29-like protein [Smittium culicis]